VENKLHGTVSPVLSKNPIVASRWITPGADALGPFGGQAAAT